MSDIRGIRTALSALLLMLAGAMACSEPPAPKPIDAPPPLLDVDATRPVTTRSPVAQRYFDQGLALMRVSSRDDAVAAFRYARTVDPTCAMCWMAEAWALGPDAGGAISDDDALAAYAAAREARQRSTRATPEERALIGAISRRYARRPERQDRASLDRAYADALQDVVRRFPDDPEASLMLDEAMRVVAVSVADARLAGREVGAKTPSAREAGPRSLAGDRPARDGASPTDG